MSYRLASFLTITAMVLTSCAGRDPQHIASTAAWDASLTCDQVRYMIAGNEREIADLQIEDSNKTASNVGWFVGGILIWPAWLMMDLKGAQKKEIADYRARNEVLSQQAVRTCNPQVAAKS